MSRIRVTNLFYAHTQLLARIPRIVVYILIILLISFQGSAFANPENDLDHDGLSDRWESELAERYQPYFVFDSAESATRSFEPVVLYQVYCSNWIELGQNCPEINIKYGLLWQRDGGYGPDSWCSDDHNGDNQSLKVLVSSTGNISSVSRIYNGKFVWPSNNYSNIEWRREHPIIYLSAHKHHQFFDTRYDHEDSPYSAWGCNDDVNGRGIKKYGTIRNQVTVYNNVNNVGEHFVHLIEDLTPLGFPGESAWGTTSFCGGLECDYDTSSMQAIWDNWPE